MCSDSIHDSVWCAERRAAHVRDRLTLRLLRTQHTAATADYLMVFTATACRSDPRTADAFWISRHISKAHRFDVIVHFARNSVNLPWRYDASSARPTRHRSNRGTTRRAERALRTRPVRLECCSRSCWGPIIDAHPDHPGICAFRLRTQLPLCRLDCDRVACSARLLLRIFSCDIPDLPRDRNRLERVRVGELLQKLLNLCGFSVFDSHINLSLARSTWQRVDLWKSSLPVSQPSM